ncbi:MAG: hypothetical protein K2O18_17385 [Oscillospiraceae bacterium]|nr:hypothetical protein [Oscillospiraceae bacterium]
MSSRYHESGAAGRGRFEGLLSLYDASVLWGLDESTIRKAIAAGRFTIGEDAQKFGKQWVVTKEAMSREFDGRRLMRRMDAMIARIDDKINWPD